MSILDTLNKFEAHDFSIPDSNLRNINKNILEKYFANWGGTDASRKYKRFIIYLLRTTRYVKFTEFHAGLVAGVTRFLNEQENKPFTILLTTKTDLWLLHLIYPILKKGNFCGTECNGVCDRLILSDCIYPNISFKEEPDRTIIYNFVTSFSSISGERTIKKWCPSAKVYRDPNNVFNDIQWYDKIGPAIMANFASLTRCQKEILLTEFLGKLRCSLHVPIYFDHSMRAFKSIYVFGAYIDQEEILRYYGQLVQVCEAKSRIELVCKLYNTPPYK